MDIVEHHFPVFARADVIDDLRARLPYCFADKPYPGAPLLDFMPVKEGELFDFAGISIEPLPVMHHKLILGYRIGPMAYITDAKKVYPEVIERLKGIPLLVINALRYRPHNTHMSLNETLEVVREISPGRTYLIHMSDGIGLHAQTERQLPADVHLAYDGLIVQI